MTEALVIAAALIERDATMVKLAPSAVSPILRLCGMGEEC
jgi:hypothetical protein